MVEGGDRDTLLDGRESVGELISLLGHPSLRVRRAAIAALADRDPSETLPGLFATLADDDNAAARNAAADVLLRYGAPVVGALARALDANGARDRTIHLLGVLGRIPSQPTLEAVAPLATHPDPSVAAAAIACLGALKDPAVVPTLLAVLDKGERWQTFYAIDALGEVGHAAAVTRLIPLIGDPYYRKAVLRALGRIGDESAARPLVEALVSAGRPDRTALAALSELVERSRTGAGRQAIVRRIGEELQRVRDVGLIDGLAAWVRDGDPESRSHAVQALGWTGEKLAVRPLVALLSEPTLEEVAAEALDRLGSFAAAEIIECVSGVPLPPEGLRRVIGAVAASASPAVERLVIASLEHEDDEVRQAALSALADRARPEHLDLLARMLEDRSPLVAAEAVRGLLALASASAMACREVAARVDRLISAEAPEVRRTALRVVARLNTAGSSEAMDLALRDPAAIVRREAVALLGTDSDPERLWRLTAAMADEDPRVREEVVLAISGLHDQRTRGVLLSALHDGSLWVRSRAARALADHPAAEVRVALEVVARAEALPVRVEAIEALGRLEPGSTSVLRELASDGEPEVRRAAIKALSEQAAAAAFGTVTAALEDPVWTVRCAAAEALGRAREAGTFGPLSRALDRETDAGVRRALLAALYEIDAESSLPFLVSALAEKDVADKAAGLLVAGHRTFTDALRAEWASGVDPGTREGLAVVLQEIGRRESVPGGQDGDPEEGA